jgi:GT2 family glycosyltransferase
MSAIVQNERMHGKPEEVPSISLVVITKDRRDELTICVESLRQLNYPREKVEIIIVEECSDPLRIHGVKYIQIPRQNKGWGYARNIGVRASSHDLIAFVDDDCIVTDQWLTILVGAINNDIGGVTGAVLVKDCNAVGYCENALGFPNGGLLRVHRGRNRKKETTRLSTCNCMYKKEVFETIGYFCEEEKSTGEDMELAMRASREYRCLYVPKAVVYHKPRGSFVKIFYWFVERGKGQIRIRHRVPEKGAYTQFLLKNSLTVRLAGLSTILYLCSPVWWWLLIAASVSYYGVNLRRYWFQVKYLNRYDTAFLTPLVKLTMDIGTEVGQVIEVLRRGKRWAKDWVRLKRQF